VYINIILYGRTDFNIKKASPSFLTNSLAGLFFVLMVRRSEKGEAKKKAREPKGK